VSHALLPSFTLVRRLDEVGVVGRALAGVVGGRGMRSLAWELAVPHETLRGWRRRYRTRSPTLAAGFAALAVGLGGLAPELSREPERAGLEALGAAWWQARRRFGEEVPGAMLFLLVDDHSRLLVHGNWCGNENTRAGQQVLRAAIMRRGLPEQLYVDNGAPFANAALQRTCAVLGIRLIHSRPYSPEGRGKQERLNRVIRERFLLEAEAVGVSDLQQLNDRFAAWAESYLNCRLHSETGQTPIARFQAQGAPRAADPQLLHEAFRWSCLRKVSRTACVRLLGNRYQVDAALVGRQVELRYDPEDLSRISVHFQDWPVGDAVPFRLDRHVHPQVPQAVSAPAEPTGTDYLGLVLAAHDDATREGIAYRKLDLIADRGND